MFHLATDPFELHDVSDEYPEVADGLRAILLDRIDRHKKRGALLGVAGESSEEDLEPKILEELRSLGYIQ